MNRLSVLLIVTLLAGCSPRLQKHEYVELVMASPARLVLYAEDEASARRAARATYDRLHELERVLSDWNPESELNLLVAAAPEWRRTSQELRQALRQAVHHAGATGGGFDPTLGPLVTLWRETRTTGTLPSSDRIDAARALVDFDAIEFEGEVVRVARPGVQVDLGGFAKGFALDEAARLLEKRGFPRHLLDLDGEIRAGSPPPGSSGWRVEILPPGHEQTGRTLLLKDRSVSTSGDRHQFIEIDGTRYSHVLDPATGLGLVDPVQVTVIAARGETSDALATAGCVLGAEGLRTVMERHYPDAAAIVTTGQAGHRIVTTIGMLPARVDDAP